MKNKNLAALTAFLLILGPVWMPLVYAAGGREAGASLILPTTGQAMNGQLGEGKTKLMAGIEVAAITTIAIVGWAVGGPAVWFGVGPLLANHVWSSADAYKNAQGKQYNYGQEEMLDAQRNLELSRQRRYEREQAYRSDVRERIRRAGEQEY